MFCTFVKCIPEYFILYDFIVRVVFLISFSFFLLPLYRNTIQFFVLVMYLATLLNPFISWNSCLEWIPQDFLYISRDSFPSFPIFLSFPFFGGALRFLDQPGIEPLPCGVEALSLNHWTAKEVLSLAFLFLAYLLWLAPPVHCWMEVVSGHPCLVPDLSGEASSLCPVSMKVAAGLS